MRYSWLQANIEIQGTDVGAQTIHALFDLDGEYKSKIDFTKLENPKVEALLHMKAPPLLDKFFYQIARFAKKL